MSKVLQFHEHHDSAMSWNPEQMYADALKKVREDGATKSVVLVLTDHPADMYNVRIAQCGMKNSEVLALLEYAKGCVLDEMYSGGDEGC